MDPLAYLFSLEQFGIKFGLDNMRAIVARLDHPERAFRSVHIAGTNGKGSVTAMIDAGLRAASYRVGRYTSPHLMTLSERFVIDGQRITDEAMIDAVSRVRDVVDALLRDGTLSAPPTFFEVTTAAAFESFRRASVELAVVEVGLGGRLDATNVLIPEVTAITSIAFDHEQYLGRTIGAIAREKAGIVKPGVPVVLGGLDPDALAVIEEVARDVHAPIRQTSASDVAGETVDLSGTHQRGNAAIARGVLDVLNERGIRISPAARGAALHAKWPGRLDARQLPDGRELLLDAAHNPSGARALADFLREQPGPKAPLVLAIMRDKDVDGILHALLPEASSLTATRASHPRSSDPGDLARVARSIAPSLPIAAEPSILLALDLAWRTSSPPPRIVVAGSIFLLGDVMQRLGLHW